MIAFTVKINGKKIATAGVGDKGVLTVVTSWVNRKVRDPKPLAVIPGQFEECCHLELGGLASREDEDAHLLWAGQDLCVGDEIKISVLETEKIDEPKSERRIKHKDAEENERKYYEQLKKKFDQ
jgi:hypothetical protein